MPGGKDINEHYDKNDDIRGRYRSETIRFRDRGISFNFERMVIRYAPSSE